MNEDAIPMVPLRRYTELATEGSSARMLVDKIADKSLSSSQYRETMIEIGRALAAELSERMSDSKEDVYVVCTVEDADFLARGIIEVMNDRGFKSRLKLMCLWNGKIREEGISLSPVLKQYKELVATEKAFFIVVKSIISGACVVKTNLTRAISSVTPEKIFVVSPVLREGAQQRLQREFSPAIADKFEFLWFATDFTKTGENVEPGIGGQVYERLGLGSEETKIAISLISSKSGERNSLPLRRNQRVSKG